MTITRSNSLVAPLLRFDRVQRVAHWANAALFTVLIVTAVPLYFGSLFGVVLPRHLVETIHLWCGLALPFPVVTSLLGPRGRQMRHDLQRINYWTRDEIHWLRSFGQTALSRDKFNPGQKLNALFTGAVIIVMLVTGSILQWFRFFPVSWRSGATLVHDTFSYVIVVVVVGHVILAITHRDSLRSMLTGRVSEQWARIHAPRWLAEASTTSEGETHHRGDA